MNRELLVEKLTAEKFKKFGDVVEPKDNPLLINKNKCERHNDLAFLQVSNCGHLGVSIFSSEKYTLPFQLLLMERHPLGSQCFIPMSEEPFLVIVSADKDGCPERPSAFITNGKQGINYKQNIWHSVLTPSSENTLFTVIDRIGSGKNVEEFIFDQPWLIRSLL